LAVREGGALLVPPGLPRMTRRRVREPLVAALLRVVGGREGMASGRSPTASTPRSCPKGACSRRPTRCGAVRRYRSSSTCTPRDTHDAILRLVIRDDGIGRADPGQGSGLLGLRDRIEALGGTFEVTSPARGGTTC
jgi:hypothetical protein